MDKFINTPRPAGFQESGAYSRKDAKSQRMMHYVIMRATMR